MFTLTYKWRKQHKKGQFLLFKKFYANCLIKMYFIHWLKTLLGHFPLIFTVRTVLSQFLKCVKTHTVRSFKQLNIFTKKIFAMCYQLFDACAWQHITAFCHYRAAKVIYSKHFFIESIFNYFRKRIFSPYLSFL